MKAFRISGCVAVPVFIVLFFLGCDDKIIENGEAGCGREGLLESFVSAEGHEIFIYENGKAYISRNDSCIFALNYFEPGFVEAHYVMTDSGTFLIADEGTLVPTKNDFSEDFDRYTGFTDLFVKSLTDPNLFWTGFTLQSPAAPEIADYVALRKCILAGTCSFIDNRIEIAPDPVDASNNVLKFTSVPPTSEMITAKASIESLVTFFTKGSELWFQADYYIENGMPFSLVDFENAYFYLRPGPRVVIRNNKLNIENKFGAKINYSHDVDITLPQQQWFTVTVHLKFSNSDDGMIQLWQDGTLLISTTGITLPTSNSVQSVLEVGITATPVGSVLYLDNLRISETPF